MAAIDAVAPGDIPALLELVRELAQFERIEHEWQATPESYREAFFGKTPHAGGLLARVKGEPVAYAIYFFTFSSFVGRRGIWLEDVYVRPEFRRQGIGRQLIRAVARVGVEHNCGRFEWTALNWNSTALDIYRKMGARVMDDWVLWRLDAPGLRCLAESIG